MNKNSVPSLVVSGQRNDASSVIHITCLPESIHFRTCCTPQMCEHISLQKTIDKYLFPSQMTVACTEVLPPHHLHRLFIIRLPNGSRCILKMSPAPNILMLRHETGLLEREASILLFLADSNLPIPQALRYEAQSSSVASPFLLTSHLPGLKYSEALPYLSRIEKTSIEAQLTSIRLHISQHSSGKFGLVHDTRSRNLDGAHGSWSEAFSAMMENVLQDGEDMMVNIAYFEIRGALERSRSCLDEITEPSLVVLGLRKAENVLIDRRTNKVVGLLDLGMALWGDPAMGNIEGKTDVRSLL